MTTRDHLTEKQVEDQYRPLFRLKTLQTWRALRQGPRFVRIGRRIFYPRQAIEDFIQASVVEPESPRGASAPAPR
jgi:hypothetical protein